MNILAIITIAPGAIVRRIYFLDGIEITADEYCAIQAAAMARAFDEAATA